MLNSSGRKRDNKGRFISISIPREILYKLYWKEGKTIKEIAELLGFSRSFVAKKMREYGVPRRNHSERLKGRIHRSLEYRKKISRANKGRRPWNKGYGEYIRGSRNPMWGRHHTEETKRKLSELKKGKYVGPKNPNWKGGRVNYGPNWNAIKRRVLERYGYRCLSCMRKFDDDQSLVAHHVIPARDCVELGKFEMLRNEENLIPLCRRCHWKIHNAGRYDIIGALALLGGRARIVEHQVKRERYINVLRKYEAFK